MLKEHARVLDVIRTAGEICGRKKLQKMIFIAKKLSFPFEERFDFHFYGPYSEELTLKIEELVNMGFLREEKEKKGNFLQYRYTLTESGERFLQLSPVAAPEALRTCVEDMNNQSPRFLELVSTILYFDHLPEERVREKVRKVKSKQNYTGEEMDRAFQYIEQLRKWSRSETIAFSGETEIL